MLIGIPGLRWSDVSAQNAPELWRLAGAGSVGSLVVSGVHARSCPADGWLTLNSGARAAGLSATQAAGPGAPCPPLPAVVPAATLAAPGGARPASVPAMPRVVAANRPFHYDPEWGLLARAAGPGRCATAIGPGAALALAGPGGRVGSYLPSAAALSRSVLRRCPLTVIDLGALPSGAGKGGAAARARAVRAADAATGRIRAALPAGTILAVAGLADDSAPHMRAMIVAGPGYQAGLLAAASTRQPGMTLITDLTPTVLGWLAAPVPAAAVGSPVTRTDRGSLAAAIRVLIGQDTAAQVYRSTILPFFLAYGFGEGIAFGLLTLALRGRGEERRRRRLAAYRVAGVFAGAIPAGTFLASLVPWWQLPHPALLLYAMALGWAALITAAALAGPWRREPFGPPGAVAAITVAVIGLDVMTGSRLQLGTPFGLSALAAGRFYGVGNNALGIYGTSGILLAAWAAIAAGRGRLASGGSPAGAGQDSGPAAGGPAGPAAGGPVSAGVIPKTAAQADGAPASAAVIGQTAAQASGTPAAGRGRAAAAAAAVAVFTVVASGWPGFGAKVGGTIAMVPGFLLLIAAVAGVRITVRRGLAIGVSGLVLVTGFAVLNYLVPATGPSDIGAFVGHVLHGGSGGILQRKVSANVGSLTTTIYSPIVPLVVIAAALIIAWPGRFRLRALADAVRALPLLRPVLTAIWLVAALGWIADDSGVTVAASAIPLALMLVIAVVSAAGLMAGRGRAATPGTAAGSAAGAAGPGAAVGPSNAGSGGTVGRSGAAGPGSGADPASAGRVSNQPPPG